MTHRRLAVWPRHTTQSNARHCVHAVVRKTLLHRRFHAYTPTRHELGMATFRRSTSVLSQRCHALYAFVGSRRSIQQIQCSSPTFESHWKTELNCAATESLHSPTHDAAVRKHRKPHARRDDVLPSLCSAVPAIRCRRLKPVHVAPMRTAHSPQARIRKLTRHTSRPERVLLSNVAHHHNKIEKRHLQTRQANSPAAPSEFCAQCCLQADPSTCPASGSGAPKMKNRFHRSSGASNHHARRHIGSICQFSRHVLTRGSDIGGYPHD